MMSDLLFRRWCREHLSSMRYRQFRVLKSTIFVISTLWTDLVAGVAALEAYRLLGIHELVTAGISRLRQTSQKCIDKSATNTHNGTARTVRACYTNALYQVSSSAAPFQTCADWTGPSDPGRHIPGKERGKKMTGEIPSPRSPLKLGHSDWILG